ncbi:MAG: hypothetical protein WAW54_08115 [Parvibaculum sedimenti]
MLAYLAMHRGGGMSLISRLVEGLRGRLEMPEHRAAARADDPVLIISIGGIDHQARNWSTGGACIDNFTSAAAVGDIVSGTLRWKPAAPGQSFAAEVTRVAPGGILALKWLDIPEFVLLRMETEQQ